MIYDDNTPPMLIQIGKKLEKTLPTQRYIIQKYNYITIDKSQIAYYATDKPYINPISPWWSSLEPVGVCLVPLWTYEESIWIENNWKQCIFKLGAKR